MLSIRLIAAAERSTRDPGGATADIIVIVVILVATPSVFVLINRHRAIDARGRRERLQQLGRLGWLSDVSLDTQTRASLGLTKADEVLTFALVQTEGSLEFWGRIALEADAAIGWDQIVNVEPGAMSWTSEAGSAIILTIRGESSPILLDLIGPVFGTLPVTARQRSIVVGALEGHTKAKSSEPGPRA